MTEDIFATRNTAPHKAKITALGRIVGQPVAKAVTAHLDSDGVDRLIEALKNLPGNLRQRQIAELKTWSESQP
jgi:hypothetical protein